MLNNIHLVGNATQKQQMVTKLNVEQNPVDVRNNIYEDQIYPDYFQKREAEITKTGLVKIYEVIQSKKEKSIRTLVNQFQAHQGQVLSLSWQSPKYNNLIATCGVDKKIIIWKEQCNGWKEEKVWKCHDNCARDIQWAQDRFTLAIGYQNGILEVIEGLNFKSTNTVAYNKELICLDWLRNSKEQVLITGGKNDDQNLIKIWNVLSDQQTIIDKVFEFKVDAPLRCVKFAPQIFNYQIQAAISYDGFIMIFTMGYNEQFIKPITVIKQQKIEFLNCNTLNWSLLGDELIANQVISLYQNENNEFQTQN